MEAPGRDFSFDHLMLHNLHLTLRAYTQKTDKRKVLCKLAAKLRSSLIQRAKKDLIILICFIELNKKVLLIFFGLKLF